jgi:hypothetical protein
MSMKAPLPPNFQPPTWATKEFRRSLLLVLMGVAVIGWLVVDIAPRFTQKPTRAAKAQDPNAFVPQPAAAGAAREVKFEGVLEKVKDGTPIDDQDESYQYLLRFLARAETAHLNKEAKSVDYSYYSKLPAELRGQTVKILALFLQSNPIRVDAAPGGVKFIHRTYLMDLSGNEGFVVDLVEPPGDLESRTLVGMDAVFLKLGTYESKKGSVQAPLFLGKGLHVVKERMAADPVSNLSGGVVAGAGIAMMLAILALTARMFKKSAPSAPRPPSGPSVSLDALKS